jgi:hypothetical protein
MEGMYMNWSEPTIILSTLRPAGRRAYTCAHEIGHHVFGHGAHVDEELNNDKGISIEQLEADEYLVECFAGFLLMPKVAVCHGFAKRGWNISECTPEQAYIVAGWLGVGYTTLVRHMSHSLKSLPSRHGERLMKVPLRKIRRSILNQECKEQLVVVGQEWFGRPIDIEVGDLILFGHEVAVEGSCVEAAGGGTVGQLFRGVAPGIGRCYSPKSEWAEFVRVSRKEYVGHWRYRHLEEPIDE